MVVITIILDKVFTWFILHFYRNLLGFEYFQGTNSRSNIYSGINKFYLENGIIKSMKWDILIIVKTCFTSLLLHYPAINYNFLFDFWFSGQVYFFMKI